MSRKLKKGGHAWPKLRQSNTVKMKKPSISKDDDEKKKKFFTDSLRTGLPFSPMSYFLRPMSTTTNQRQEKYNNRKRKKSIQPSTWSEVLGNIRSRLNVYTNGVSGKSLQPRWKRAVNFVKAGAAASVNEMH